MSNTKIKAGQFSGIVGHGTDGYFLMTNGDGTMAWAEGGATGPSVTSVSYPGDDLAADPTGGQTVVLTGTNFGSSMTVSIGGTTAPSVAHDSSTQLTITTPAKAAGDYDIVVTNTVTGASGTFVNGISYNGIPTWTTAAGSLGAFESETTISTITLQATEPDGGTITFNITNGALPTGLSLTGANIDGTTTAESSTTLYSFTIEAIDDENQATPRNFSITVNAAAITPFENFTINTYTGNGSTQSIEGKIGTAAQFNGSSSEVEVSSNVLNINTISISAWINLSTTSGFQQIVSNYSSLNTGWGLRVNDGGYLAYNTGVVVAVSSTPLSTNTWYHVAVTVDSSGNSTKLYINGSEDSSTTYTAATYGAGNTNFHIGSLGNINVQYFNGKIDQVRIFNKALSTDNNGVNEITTLYSENNASSTKSTTDIFGDGSGVALYEFEEGAKDTGGVSGYIGSGGIFNGSSSKIDLGTAVLGQTYTVSMWINPSTVTSLAYERPLYSQYRTVSNRHIVNIYDAGLRVFCGDNGTFLFSTSWTTNTWYHIVVTKSTTGYTVYKNGVSLGFQASTADINVLDNTEIGSWDSDGSAYYYFDGKIDQVRIFNKAISSSEVTTLYGETSASSTKSTTDIFDDGSGIALYELEGNALGTGKGAIDSGQSAVFNGSSSYINTNYSLNFGDTISLWFKLNDRTQPNIFFEQYTGSFSWALATIVADGSNNVIAIQIRQDTGIYYYMSSDTFSISNGEWNFITVSFVSGNNYTLTLNGASVNLTATTVSGTVTSMPSATNYLGLRREGVDQYFNGSIDQVRIYNTALSSGDVTNLYNETNVPTANLVAHYKLDGDATDETTNYNGTATNITYSDPAEFPKYDGTATNVSYAYDGTPTNVSFAGTSFQPDLVWIKSRTTSVNHNIVDSVRGLGDNVFKVLFSNTTDAENTTTNNNVLSLDSNGFAIQGAGSTTNANGENYVAWCWKAGGVPTPNNNTQGTITSTVSANPDAGFSIVSYTGSGANATIGHGLSDAPDMIIVKRRNASGSWNVYHSALGNNSTLILQSTTAQLIGEGTWGTTTPTSSVFTVGTGLNDTNNYIAYCFHSVDGYQKIGSYDGGTITSSNIVNLGFRPRFVLLKPTQTANDWLIYDNVRDTSNPLQHILYPRTSGVEQISTDDNYNLYTTDSGFYFNNTSGFINSSASDVIYLAIA